MGFLPAVLSGFGWLGVLLSVQHAQSAELSVANLSFELPVTEVVDLWVDSWQKLPKPDWFVEGQGQTWDQLIGTFKDDPENALTNIAGDQAIYLFAVPEVGLFQDLLGRPGPAPVIYSAGTGYELRF